MTRPASEVEPGGYARKQLGCGSWAIRFGHAARFEHGRRLVAPHSGGRLLDYGCGDGTFLARVADLFPDAVGADRAADHLEDDRKRFARPHPGVRFLHTSELSGPEHAGAYRVVTCMEVLEHCVPADVDVVLADLARLVATDGVVIISVPIEVGPSFVVKWAARGLAAYRGLSDYRHYERYSWREAARMVFAGSGPAIPRPTYQSPDGPFHSHYGFNWRQLRRDVRRHLTVVRTSFSPLGWLGGLASSQAWFECRRDHTNG
jgi:SAM-dependent methyltransferase